MELYCTECKNNTDHDVRVFFDDAWHNGYTNVANVSVDCYCDICGISNASGSGSIELYSD